MKKAHLILFPLLLVSYEMATYLSTDMYLPALPQMSQSLGISYHLVQLTLTLWFFGSASLQFVVGPLSDYYGRRPVLLIGGLFFLISTIVCAGTSDITILLIARFIQGTAVCSAIVAGYAAIHESLEQKQVIQTLAWMSSITVLAPALGPVLGAAILHFGDWRLIFICLAVFGGISIALLFKFMPESNPDGKTKHPIHLKKLLHNYGLIFSSRSFRAYSFTFCCLFGGFIAWISAGAFLVVNSFNYSVNRFTFFQCLIFGAFILATRFVKVLLNRISPQHLIYIGTACCLIGASIGALLSQLLPNMILGLIIPLMLYGVGAGLSFSPLSRLAIESSDQAMGAKMAMFSSGISITGVSASVLVMIFYNGSLTSLAYLIAALALAAGLIQLKHHMAR